MPSDLTIKQVVNRLNNTESDGAGYWLPNIQREFVWSEAQITRLFDSVLRSYPIGSFLFWKTKSPVRSRKFIENYSNDLRLKDHFVTNNEKVKILVLDGQQRLQSFFIGLKGSYDGKELYVDILSGREAVPPDDAKYILKFKNTESVKFPFVRFKDIVYAAGGQSILVNKIKNCAETESRSLSNDELDIIRDNIAAIQSIFSSDILQYSLLDSVDNGDTYTEDDVVEIFIRANSGGTRLEKSDLLFSLLSASWENATEEIEDLIDHLSKRSYKFTRDFVLKTCVCILTKNAKLSIDKFRNEKLRKEFIDNWKEITAAFNKVVDFLHDKTYIRSNEALTSYYPLIPLIYFAYEFPKLWKKSDNLDTYLIQCLLSGVFSGSSDTQLTQIISNISRTGIFDINEIYSIIREKRTLELKPSYLLSLKYGAKQIPLIFNLWYREFNYKPAYQGNLPQEDHIFPQTHMKKVKINGKKLKADEINQLANLMLLPAEENGSNGKSDKLPEEWFANKSEEYLDMHLIPKNPELWKVENYFDFIDERKKLILEKFKQYLTKEDIENKMN